MKITNETGCALWVLAANHYHDWSKMTDIPTIRRDGWEKMTEDVTDAMNAYEADRAANGGHGLPCGLPPATSHTTGTGRLKWYVDYMTGRTPSPETQGLRLEVTRPAPGLFGSSSAVMRVAVRLWLHAEGPGYAWTIEAVEIVKGMVELRHLQAVATALFGECQTADIRSLLTEIDGLDGPFTERIEAEMVAEAAAMARENAGQPALVR